jgi:hypothetical protein
MLAELRGHLSPRLPTVQNWWPWLPRIGFTNPQTQEQHGRQTPCRFSGVSTWPSILPLTAPSWLLQARSGQFLYLLIMPLNTPNAEWQAIASSANGRNVAIAGFANGIYVSSDYGLTWRSNNVAGMPGWTGVACSADGSKLMAVAHHVGVFISTDFGNTWVQDTNQMNAMFFPEGLIGEQLSIISSADGSKLVLIPGQYFEIINNDVMWISYSIPAPQLSPSFSGTNLVLSWTVPSTNFVLQQNSDLTTTNWSTVTSAVTLNLSNLQNQVSLSPTNGSSFFRLTSP